MHSLYIRNNSRQTECVVNLTNKVNEVSDEAETEKVSPIAGNKFWMARARSGPPLKYENAEDLQKDCIKYFEWVDNNPLMSAEKVTHQGHGSTFLVPKMRAMTVVGLCNFLGIRRSTWYSWKSEGELKREDLMDIIAWAEEIIFQQKFEGASADLLNANIIARDLGLAEKKELTGADGGAIQFANLTDEELERRIVELTQET